MGERTAAGDGKQEHVAHVAGDADQHEASREGERGGQHGDDGDVPRAAALPEPEVPARATALIAAGAILVAR